MSRFARTWIALTLLAMLAPSAAPAASPAASPSGSPAAAPAASPDAPRGKPASFVQLPFLAELASTGGMVITSNGELPPPFDDAKSPQSVALLSLQKPFLADFTAWFAGDRITPEDYRKRLGIKPDDLNAAPEFKILRQAMTCVVLALESLSADDAAYLDLLRAAVRFLGDMDAGFGCPRTLIARLIMVACERGLVTHLERRVARGPFSPGIRKTVRDLVTEHARARRPFAQVVRDEQAAMTARVPSAMVVSFRYSKLQPADRALVENQILSLMASTHDRILRVIEVKRPTAEGIAALKAELKSIRNELDAKIPIKPATTRPEAMESAAAGLMKNVLANYAAAWERDSSLSARLEKLAGTLAP